MPPAAGGEAARALEHLAARERPEHVREFVAHGRLVPEARTATDDPSLLVAPGRPEPTVAEVRAWARSVGLEVPGRGRLRPEIWDAWRSAH